MENLNTRKAIMEEDFKSELEWAAEKRLDELVTFSQGATSRNSPSRRSNRSCSRRVPHIRTLSLARAEKAKKMTTPTDIANRARKLLAPVPLVTDGELVQFHQ